VGVLPRLRALSRGGARVRILRSTPSSLSVRLTWKEVDALVSGLDDALYEYAGRIASTSDPEDRKDWRATLRVLEAIECALQAERRAKEPS